MLRRPSGPTSLPGAAAAPTLDAAKARLAETARTGRLDAPVNPGARLTGKLPGAR